MKALIPTKVYLLKFNNRNTRKRCEICTKLTIKTQSRRSVVFIVIFTPSTVSVVDFVLTRKYLFASLVLVKALNVVLDTAWKVPVFEVFLDSIFPDCIQSECGKIRTRKTLNADTFYAVGCVHHNVTITTLGFGFRTLSDI